MKPAPFAYLRPSTLEEALAALAELAAALEHLRGWAAGNGLATSEVAYVAATRDQRPLRFTADGDQATERAWRTHWMRADLPEAARERLTRRQSKPPDLVVIEPLNEWRCTACGGSGWVLFMEGPGPLCMDCADLGHLVFLPAGNAALSRRAKRASRLSAVVVRFSRARKRYERQGILVEEAALEQAEAQLQSMRQNTLKEPGCVFMHLLQPQDDSGIWVMLEMFRSRAAWDEHMRQPYNTEGNKILEDLLRAPSELRLCDEK